MTDNAPKPLTAEELANLAERVDAGADATKLHPDVIAQVTVYTGQLRIAAALVAAIDRNTEALKDLKLIVQHPVTVIEREQEGGTQ